MKRAREPKNASLDSNESQPEASRPAKRTKKSVQPIKLFDISSIQDRHGGEDFYCSRFFTWRRINRRDDPGQSLAAKINSWRTFIRLENENKMDFLLKKTDLKACRGSEAIPTIDQSSIGHPDTISDSRKCVRYQERQPRGSHDVSKYLRLVGSRATERKRSDLPASFDGTSLESDHPYDPQLTPPGTDDLRESQSTEVGLNVKTIERLWRWKSAHRAQIEELQQHRLDLTLRCESLEARCDEHDSRYDDLQSSIAQISVLKSEFESKLQQGQDYVHELQKKTRDLKHDRLLGAVEEAGLTLTALRDEFETRISALETVENESFDILQRLYADKKLQDGALSHLCD